MSVEMLRVSLPVRKDAQSIVGVEAREVLFLCARNESRSGYGECAPLTGLHIETLDECMLALEDWSDGLIEIDALAPQLARRARHVVHESARVHEMCTALAANDLARVGALFFESHQSLRDDFDVSTHALDAIVERARSEGVLGARMTGGGFGGCVIIVRRA